MEIGTRAERIVDARFTRRLIELEISDVELPPDPRTLLQTALFFRVLAVHGDQLRVELWERGQLHGARGVSLKGNAQLVARRVALAAAELTRQVSHKRRQQARLLAVREAQRLARLEGAHDAERTGLGMVALGRAAAVGAFDAWLGGPELGLRAYPRPWLGLELHGALLAGEWRAQNAPLRWLELGLGARTRLAEGARLRLDLGVAAAAAVLRLNRLRAVDEVEHAEDSWSARAAALLALSGRLGRGARLEAGPELGLLLRPVPATDTREGSRQLSGVWLGVSVGVIQGL